MDGTSTLDTLPDGAAGQEPRVNNLANAMSGAAMFGRRASTSSGLNWGFYGAIRLHINASVVTRANGTLAITASATRYISVDRATLALTEVATAFAADKFALYKVTSGATAVNNDWEDHRDPHHLVRFLYGRVVKAMADANVTLTYQEAMCESIECTGTNTALRDLIVPLVPRQWTVFANTATNGVRVIGASGTGVTIAVGKTAIVECDGTNVRRITADNP